MTFKERLMQDHPEKSGFSENSLIFSCPCKYGYESRKSSLINCLLRNGKGCNYCWNREIPEERKDDMENLKEKMDITTLVQYEDGRIGMVFMNHWSEDNKAIFDRDSCIGYLSDFNEELINASTINERKIIKIKFPSNDCNYRIVKKFFAGEIDPEYIKWDWERKDHITKDVSLEEINAILKEKFPDVDEFNLPIKE